MTVNATGMVQSGDDIKMDGKETVCSSGDGPTLGLVWSDGRRLAPDAGDESERLHAGTAWISNGDPGWRPTGCTRIAWTPALEAVSFHRENMLSIFVGRATRI